MNAKYDDIQSQNFLNFVLQRSELLVFHITPVYQAQPPLDFTLDFATDNLEKYINRKVTSLLEKKLSDIFPVIFQNGISEILQSCMEKEGMEIVFERRLDFCTTSVWLESKATRYNNGIIITSRDISEIKKTEEKLRVLNNQLEFQNTILKDAERISLTASFRWNINEDFWVFSDNLAQLFDIPLPKLLEHQENGIFDIIPKNVGSELRSLIEENLYNDALPEFTFSRTTKSGNEKYYALSGNFVPVREGQMLLGVIRDITSSVESEIHLMKKNQELLQINTELDSFNHITSHDLQEPLRKIRMFISRVMDLDRSNFEDKGLGYLQKINSAAERMQELIQHLLTYSRIGKTSIKAETVHLDTILETIKEDVSEELEKSGAVIHHDRLGSVEGIPFLIHQLIFNIITNSLKYAKDEIPAEIQIDSRVIHRKSVDFLDGEIPKTSDFLELRFTDNGIGFKQEHAERIFELFQRLHQKNEYSGTGIGLAICKKIVETHHGHIFARSQPDVGTEIKIYLPRKN